MSKNGKDYELFIKDVYTVLNTADGLTNVDIQHNVVIQGISRNHQIDVFWQFQAGGVQYKVVVECKDYNTPVKAEKIEAFRSVLLDIGGVFGIYASRNGFQKGAVDVAKTYGIQLMQIREPLVSDWEGKIRKIHIDYIIRNVCNVRPLITVDEKWLKESGLDFNINDFTSSSDQIFIVSCQDEMDEERISIHELKKKFPDKKEGNDFIYEKKYDNAYLECRDKRVKIMGIQIKYDVHFKHQPQVIDVMKLVKAVVNNVITGEYQFIDIHGNVKEMEK